MLLKALYSYAEIEGLTASIEISERPIHLLLRLRDDGSVDPAGAWLALSTSRSDTRGKIQAVPGRALKLPAFPGVNSGGKAYFLADDVTKVLGIDPRSGDPIPEEGANNASKAFRHFWQRIDQALAATGLPVLKTLIEFRRRYICDPDARRKFPGIGVVPYGKKNPKPTLCALTDEGPVPLEKRAITFSVDGNRVFSPGSPLHEYWKGAFNRERFAGSGPGGAADIGVCLVTSQENQRIAESHRTPIKGVPGLPPIGGYLVSFDDATPSLRSYALDKAFQAPVSEQAAAAYALGLNDILARREYSRRINDFVLCAWVHEDPSSTEMINGVLVEPTDDAVDKFHRFAREGRLSQGWSTRHFRSVTLAANGGRVVVRRWLDVPLSEAVDSVSAWLDDLELAVIPPPPPKGRTRGGKQPTSPPESATVLLKGPRPYRSLDALAWSTARTPSDVRPDVYDAILRATYAKDANPEALLPAALHRLRVATVESGANVRYHANRFALIKVILKRLENQPVNIEPQLCQTHDPAYNCGRLLAVLDDIQYRAQKDVGADILARYYGNASTFPRNVFPRLLRLARAHLNKLSKDDAGAESALQRKINDICALFPCSSPGAAPQFPGLLNLQEQGRFALGFYQQKAKDQRDRDEFLAERKAQGQKTA